MPKQLLALRHEPDTKVREALEIRASLFYAETRATLLRSELSQRISSMTPQQLLAYAERTKA